MRNRLAAALLACVGIAFGSEVASSPRSDWFLKLDGVAVGLAGFRGHHFPDKLPGGTLIKATAHWRCLRFGASVMELWLDPADGDLGPSPVPMLLPLYAGFDLVDRRTRTWFFSSSLPNVYAEAGVSLIPPTVLVSKAALACDVDYCGVGVRLEAGGYVVPQHHTSTLYAALLLRFPTLGFEL